MSSNILYNIETNFPIAGQDNDTKTFRDNWDTIKESLRQAQIEVTDLQTNTAGLQLNETPEMDGSDFQKRIIYNAVLQNVRNQKFPKGTTLSQVESALTVDFENGGYQVFKFTSAICNLDFLNLPGDSALTGEPTPIGVGKITLELYGDGSTQGGNQVNFQATNGIVFKKNAGFPSPFVLTSATNPVIVDVWRHTSGYIFLHSYGQYS